VRRDTDVAERSFRLGTPMDRRAVENGETLRA
jgi:hypothetical protein